MLYFLVKYSNNVLCIVYVIRYRSVWVHVHVHVQFQAKSFSQCIFITMNDPVLYRKVRVEICFGLAFRNSFDFFILHAPQSNSIKKSYTKKKIKFIVFNILLHDVYLVLRLILHVPVLYYILLVRKIDVQMCMWTVLQKQFFRWKHEIDRMLNTIYFHILFKIQSNCLLRFMTMFFYSNVSPTNACNNKTNSKRMIRKRNFQCATR